MDTIFQLLANHGGTAVGWAATLLLMVGTFVLARLGLGARAKAILQAAYSEIVSAVREVAQTYVAELKLANADNRLTADEKDKAFSMALRAAKANIGTKGLKRLATILKAAGIDIEGWLGSKIESAVHQLRVEENASTPGVKLEAAAPAAPFGN